MEHDLVATLKELALELGRIPRRDEFTARVKGGDYKLNKLGGYSILLQAAGLETYGERRSVDKIKFTKAEIYGADIAQVVESHVPKVIESAPKDFKPMLLIGDTHFPFAHQRTLEKVYRFAERHQPAFIVQMGDLMDQWAHSRFPASRNYYKPDEEMELARKQAEIFWSELKRACPKSAYYQISGNHDERAIKQILSSAPSLESFVREGIRRMYTFEGVTTIFDYRDSLQLQGIDLHHGFFSRLGQHMEHVQNNTATAHTHKGGVVFKPLKGRTIAHLDCGFTGDQEAKAMSYTPTKTTGWTLGLGFWDEYGPRFIPA
jgi:predicted phosphodiesterase